MFKTARQKPSFCRLTIWCRHCKLVRRRVRRLVGHLAHRRKTCQTPHPMVTICHNHIFAFPPTFLYRSLSFWAVQNERGMGLITWFGGQRCECLGIVLKRSGNYLRKARCSCGDEHPFASSFGVHKEGTRRKSPMLYIQSLDVIQQTQFA